MSFNDLYQEIILDHYKHPRNQANLDYLPEENAHENPSCGDSLKLDLELDNNGRIEKIVFDGAGCAISVSSASMMTEFVKGKTIEEARDIINEYTTALRGKGENADMERFGDLAALQGVMNYPLRVKCATLAWHALEACLNSKQK